MVMSVPASDVFLDGRTRPLARDGPVDEPCFFPFNRILFVAPEAARPEASTPHLPDVRRASRSAVTEGDRGPCRRVYVYRLGVVDHRAGLSEVAEPHRRPLPSAHRRTRGRSVELEADEELRRHAPALAGVVAAAATSTRRPTAGSRSSAEQLAALPHVGEPAGVADGCRPGTRRGSRTGRRTRHPSGRSGTPPGPAPHRFSPGSGSSPSALRWKNESPVSTSSPCASSQCVDLALLGVGGVQVVPRVGTATRRAQPGDAQLRAVRIGQRLELVELVDVVAGHDDGRS